MKIRLHRARARLEPSLNANCDFYRDSGNSNPCYRPVEALRNPDIRMRPIEGVWRFLWTIVLTKCRRHVDEGIAVVNPMHTPQKRRFVQRQWAKYAVKSRIATLAR